MRIHNPQGRVSTFCHIRLCFSPTLAFVGIEHWERVFYTAKVVKSQRGSMLKSTLGLWAAGLGFWGWLNIFLHLRKYGFAHKQGEDAEWAICGCANFANCV